MSRRFPTRACPEDTRNPFDSFQADTGKPEPRLRRVFVGQQHAIADPPPPHRTVTATRRADEKTSKIACDLAETASGRRDVCVVNQPCSIDLLRPEALEPGDHRVDLGRRQYVTERWHVAMLGLRTLPDLLTQLPQRMMPGMRCAVQRRRRPATVRLAPEPLLRTLCPNTMADGAMFREDRASGYNLVHAVPAPGIGFVLWLTACPHQQRDDQRVPQSAAAFRFHPPGSKLPHAIHLTSPLATRPTSVRGNQ